MRRSVPHSEAHGATAAARYPRQAALCPRKQRRGRARTNPSYYFFFFSCPRSLSRSWALSTPREGRVRVAAFQESTPINAAASEPREELERLQARLQ
jgi:hypothetical protein